MKTNRPHTLNILEKKAPTKPSKIICINLKGGEVKPWDPTLKLFTKDTKINCQIAFMRGMIDLYQTKAFHQLLHFQDKLT